MHVSCHSRERGGGATPTRIICGMSLSLYMFKQQLVTGFFMAVLLAFPLEEP